MYKYEAFLPRLCDRSRRRQRRHSVDFLDHFNPKQAIKAIGCFLRRRRAFNLWLFTASLAVLIARLDISYCMTLSVSGVFHGGSRDHDGGARLINGDSCRASKRPAHGRVHTAVCTCSHGFHITLSLIHITQTVT